MKDKEGESCGNQSEQETSQLWQWPIYMLAVHLKDAVDSSYVMKKRVGVNEVQQFEPTQYDGACAVLS